MRLRRLRSSLLWAALFLLPTTLFFEPDGTLEAFGNDRSNTPLFLRRPRSHRYFDK